MEENKPRTSAKARMEWENKTYKKHVIRLRLKEDKDLIDYIEEEKEIGVNPTELVRRALFEYKQNHLYD